MRVIRSIRDEDGDELPVISGDSNSLIYPDDIAFFSDEERDEWRQEIRERMARRRPAGFAPWPEPVPDDDTF